LTVRPKPVLSVVVVSYNVRDRLKDCLESIQSRDPSTPPVETIVVDNDSRDRTIETLAPAFPDVRFLAMDRNLGFSIACNRGVAVAQGEWILFLNPDTILFPETLRHIHEFASSHERLGIAGCRILDGDGKLQLACRRSIPTPEVAFWRLSGLSLLFPRSRRLGRYNLTYLDPSDAYPVEAVSGSFLLIRAETHRQVGGFDEDFFLYGEDLDLCLRTTKAGWEIWYDGATTIVHHKGQSAATRPLGARMDFYRAMVTFARKNFGVGPLGALVLSAAARVLAASAHIGLLLSKWKLFLADLLGIHLGFLLASMVWLRVVYGPASAAPDRLDWIWVEVLSTWFMAALTVAGEYGPKSTTRSRLATALGAGLGGFLATGLLAKNQVYSRATFFLGGSLASALVAARHAWSARREFLRPARALVAGTGRVSEELAVRLAGSNRVRILGHLGVSREADPVVLPVAVLPHAGPALRALEVQTVVVPSGCDGVDRILSDLSVFKDIRVLLALPLGRPGEPVLVDITLDHTFPTERSG
jgi:GT2 family glycosyltransferase